VEEANEAADKGGADEAADEGGADEAGVVASADVAGGAVRQHQLQTTGSAEVEVEKRYGSQLGRVMTVMRGL